MTAKKENFVTDDACEKNRDRISLFNRWAITILISVLMGIGIFSGGAFLAHAQNDTKQDISIGQIKMQLEGLSRIEKKLDSLHDELVKKNP